MFSFLVTAVWLLNLVASVPLMLLAFSTAYWMTYVWHSPVHHAESIFKDAGELRHAFSIIIPARDEPYEVLSPTVQRLLNQTHPHVEAIISVGHDDTATLEVVRRLQVEHPGRLLLAVSSSDVHNKPTQLNAALRYCSNDVVGLLDAESLSASTLLEQVDRAFQPGVTVVQGGVVLVNHASSWLSLRSALEYFTNHRSKMHYGASMNAVLMGGNTVFFDRDLLVDQLGGWDATNLAEDAEIGIRAAAMGHRVTVAYHPDLVTQEEAPETVRAWMNQRTRWNLGFLQTLRKGVWRELPDRRQRRIALWSLLQPTFMVFTGVALCTAVITALFAHLPLWITMMSFAPLLPTVLILALEVTTLFIYSREMNRKMRLWDYARLIMSAPFYQLLLAFAAVRAAFKYVHGDFSWHKTTHVGAHLDVATVG